MRLTRMVSRTIVSGRQQVTLIKYSTEGQVLNMLGMSLGQTAETHS